MLISKGMMFILLLASLQWTRNNGVNAITTTGSANSLNSTTTSPSTSMVASSIAPAVTLKSPTAINDSTTKSTVTQSNSGTPTSSHILLSQTTHQLHFTTDDVIHSSTSINGTSPPSGMPTTSSGLSTISENYAGTTYVNSPEKASNNFTTAISNVSSTISFSPNKTQMNDITVHPTTTNSLLNATSTTLLTTKSNSATTDFRISAQTTSLYHNLTDGSAEEKEHQKEQHSHGAVVFGAIVGAVLGSALIGLVGYFMCGKRKSEPFVHQRLYDDTRNDPVLRLDNTPEPYGASFGDLSYYNPTIANETAAQNSNATPYDTIPMDDMSSSRPSA